MNYNLLFKILECRCGIRDRNSPSYERDDTKPIQPIGRLCILSAINKLHAEKRKRGRQAFLK